MTKKEYQERLLNDEAFAENELAYYENAMDGLRMAYGMLKSIHESITRELNKEEEDGSDNN